MNNIRYMLLIILVFAPFSYADEEKYLVFGQTAALSGAVSHIGRNLQIGLQAAFDEFNQHNDLQGNKLKLISLDDKNQSARAIENTKKLLEEDKVFGLIGIVGDSITHSLHPIIVANRTPLIGALSGEQMIRNAKYPYIINFRSSYRQETEALVHYLVDKLGYKKIAVFYQNDKLGHSGLEGVKDALEARGLSIVEQSAYNRDTLAVKYALLEIREARPDAVIMLGTYQPCAEFIYWGKRIGFKTTYANISIVGSYALKDILKKDAEGVIISQVVPLPSDPSIPIVSSYQQALREYAKSDDFNFISLEGYIIGRMNIEILKSIKGPITKESYIRSIYQEKNYLIDNLYLNFDEFSNQGSDEVFITKINNNLEFEIIR